MNPELPKSLSAAADESLKLKVALEAISVDALKLAETLGAASSMLSGAHASVLANAPEIIDIPVPIKPVPKPAPAPKAEPVVLNLKAEPVHVVESPEKKK